MPDGTFGSSEDYFKIPDDFRGHVISTKSYENSTVFENPEIKTKKAGTLFFSALAELGTSRSGDVDLYGDCAQIAEMSMDGRLLVRFGGKPSKDLVYGYHEIVGAIEDGPTNRGRVLLVDLPDDYLVNPGLYNQHLGELVNNLIQLDKDIRREEDVWRIDNKDFTSGSYKNYVVTPIEGKCWMFRPKGVEKSAPSKLDVDQRFFENDNSVWLKGLIEDKNIDKLKGIAVRTIDEPFVDLRLEIMGQSYSLQIVKGEAVPNMVTLIPDDWESGAPIIYLNKRPDTDCGSDKEFLYILETNKYNQNGVSMTRRQYLEESLEQTQEIRMVTFPVKYANMESIPLGQSCDLMVGLTTYTGEENDSITVNLVDNRNPIFLKRFTGENLPDVFIITEKNEAPSMNVKTSEEIKTMLMQNGEELIGKKVKFVSETPVEVGVHPQPQKKRWWFR